MAANIKISQIIEIQQQDLTKTFNKMSYYQMLSREIGFVSEPVKIPHPDVAKELLKMVRDDRNQDAFKKVFIVYHFGPQAETTEDHEAINIICEAFNVGSVIFK